MWLCKKCIQRLVHIVAGPSQSPTGHPMHPDILGKETIYILVSVVACGVTHWWVPLLPMLLLVMEFQRTRLQLHIALSILNSLLLPVTKVCNHSCHLLCIRRLRVPTDNVENMTHHPNCFVHVGLEAHPVKRTHQDIQFHLGPSQPGQGDKATVGVK